jgi:16S rRNA processing protein RimM
MGMNEKTDSFQNGEELVRIGQLGAPHGVHGEMKLFPMSDVPGRFDHLKEIVWLGLNGRKRPLLVKQVKPGVAFFFIRFEGIDTPEQAAELTRGYIAVPETSRGKLPVGTFFIDDIVGLTVEDENGAGLGTVKGIYQTGANDIYEIESRDGDFLLPALKHIILKVDLEARRLRVRIPEGLRE